MALEKLSKVIKYYFRTTIPGAGRDTIGMNTVRKDGDVISECLIEVKREGFRNTLRKNIRPAELHRERFVLATTLCHEVVHAIDGIVPEKCNRDSEIPTWHHYESQTESEIGWAWEMEVLGAIRIGCDRIGDPNKLHALPSLDQKPEELDFDEEQHIIYVRPAESVADYMTRFQRQWFWSNTPRTMKMLRISTQSDPALVGFISSTDPMETLKAKAGRDRRLKALLIAVSRKKASRKRCKELQDLLDFLSKRPTTASLIRKIYKDYPRGSREEPICLDTSDDEGEVNPHPRTAISAYGLKVKELDQFKEKDESNDPWLASSEGGEDATAIGDLLPDASKGHWSDNLSWTDRPTYDDLVEWIGQFEYDDNASTHSSMVSDTGHQDEGMDMDVNEEGYPTDDSYTGVGDSAGMQGDLMELDPNEDENITGIPLDRITGIPLIPEPPIQAPWILQQFCVREPVLRYFGEHAMTPNIDWDG
ncbi:MAG: hypothetical protein Q9169_006982 [Polycauliona sp. 2 TL-2023]